MKLQLDNVLTIVIVSLLVLLACLAAGCTGQQEESGPETVPQEEIVFGKPNWPGVTVKTHVAKNILEEKGYNVRIVSIADPGLIYAAMADDKPTVDVLLGAWLPATQRPYWIKYNHSLEKININLNQTWLGLGVPGYVYDAGIHSIPDLKGHADEFKGRIVTLEAGNGMTIASEEAIKIYDLDGFKVQTSSTPAMLAEVTRAEKKNEWIVFNAWEPHYMMLDYDIHKLEDPENLFGGGDEVVYTVARKDFKDDYPWVYEFLQEFQIDVDSQSNWIKEYGKLERDPSVVAQEWIDAHPDVVASWMPEES